MKKLFSGCVVVSVIAVTCSGAVEPAGFPLMKDVAPPAVRAGDVAAFPVDADMFDKLDNRMGNLRLFDHTDTEQPSLIRLRIPVRTTTNERPAAAATPAGSFRQLPDNRIEIIVDRNPGLPPACGLKVESGIRNFEKLVSVSGSRDGQNWTPLVGDAPIYDYSRFVDIRKDTVSFPPAAFSRFRLEISNITEKKDSPLIEIIRQTRGTGDSNETEATSFRKEPFRIERLLFIERVTETARQGEPETAEFVVSGWTTTNAMKTRQTVLEFATRRQPLTALTIGADDLNFSRAVTVEGTDSADRKTWRRVGASRISRIHAGVISQDNLTIHLGVESRCRTYRVTVDNQDNPPLTITRLAAKERLYEALFFPKAGLKYRVVYGGEDIPPPSYDIGDVLAACPAESASQWSIGPETQNPLFKTTGKKVSINGKLLLTISIVAMAAILALLIAKLVRKVGIEPRD